MRLWDGKNKYTYRGEFHDDQWVATGPGVLSRHPWGRVRGHATPEFPTPGHRREEVEDRGPDEGDDEVQGVDPYGVWVGETEPSRGFHSDCCGDGLRHGIVGRGGSVGMEKLVAIG
jgi:hypothetical protein